MAEPHENVLEIGSDMDDDEALRYAIALSLQDQVPEQDKRPLASPKPSSSARQEQEAATNTKNTAFGSMMLDRKEMEQARLQRLGKRPRAASDDDVMEVPPPKRKAPQQVSVPVSSTPASSASPPPFPNGVVKRTWALGYPRTSEDIKIEEVFQKDKLQLAVLSSFQWDDEWMMSKLDMRRTKLILLAFAANEAQKTEMRANVPPSIRFCFPAMKGPGSMHSKLQLLKYADYLRVVIPTGNLVPYDWGETGVMENMVFLVDLPRLSNSVEHQPTAFSQELGRFLGATGVEQTLVDSLTQYDFSRTSHLRLVYSIPGGHMDEMREHIGYCGLGTSVASLGLATRDGVQVDLACASLGAINSDLVQAIYNACQGDNGMAEYNERVRRPGKAKVWGEREWLQDRFRIYFPTESTVSKSRGGKRAAGTICAQEKWWRAPSFPKSLVRDCVNTRTGLLMHSKMIFVRGQRSADAAGASVEGRPSGCVYVGSANLSESAWGRLVKDRATGNAKMSCRNWECGVVLRVPETMDSTAAGKGVDTGGDRQVSTPCMDIFKGVAPVPMQFSGRPYQAVLAEPGDGAELEVGLSRDMYKSNCTVAQANAIMRDERFVETETDCRESARAIRIRIRHGRAWMGMEPWTDPFSRKSVSARSLTPHSAYCGDAHGLFVGTNTWMSTCSRGGGGSREKLKGSWFAPFLLGRMPRGPPQPPHIKMWGVTAKEEEAESASMMLLLPRGIALQTMHM
ncbi:hypothetical protein G7046_g5516 [Stylonectria norvegica]|nr:hypothetical protein G7046_g5516 [Stylonectria norvegica]